MTPLLWVAIASVYSFVALGFYALVAGQEKEPVPGQKLFMFLFSWAWPFMLSMTGVILIYVKILEVWRRKHQNTHSLFSNNGRGHHD